MAQIDEKNLLNGKFIVKERVPVQMLQKPKNVIDGEKIKEALKN